MKVSAIIAEYNPFHNGHKYMIEKVKEKSDAAAVIMSGSFVQRGDAAVTDKWSRTEAALSNGADLVIELPVTYALNTAQRFAHGSVYLADAICANELCFGSESGDVTSLINAADMIINEPAEVSERIMGFIAEGMNYPSARSRAYSGLIDADIFGQPNNILAVEYICAVKRLKSTLVPRAIKRYAVGHNDMTVSENTASASAIRNMIFDGRDISPYIPYSADLVSKPYSLSRLDEAIIYKLRCRSAEQLSQINDISEGLENRIIKMSTESTSINELAEKIKTKRYTRTRINRILLSAYLDLTKELCAINPPYIRVLGMNGTGIKILGNLKKNCRLPIITKTANYRTDDPVFSAELRATEAFSLCAPEACMRKGGADFKNSPIVL